ncbi:MAG: Glu-tRNA(Gln) amidotransferase subunit GatD [Promethearchaeota archaeon]
MSNSKKIEPSMHDDYKGYKPETISFLKKFNAKLWSRIKISGSTGVSEGIILPRNIFSPDGYVEIKLKTGYNIGIPLDNQTKIEVIKQENPMEVKFEPINPPKKAKLPNLKLIGTGGTISSRLDYVTGGVIPAFEPGELFTAVPELADICNLETEVAYKIFSENMRAKYWLELAQRVAKAANSGADGIMIAHGTDTLSYTASALSFLLKDLSVPVVCVGSQRSSDRPSSDAALNLINAAKVAGRADLAEVTVVMLGSSAHDYGYIHRGTRVRKMHSSRRDAFRTVDDTPLGMIRGNEIQYFHSDYKHRPKNNIETISAKNIEEKIGLVYAFPGMPEDLLDFYLDKDYKGIVIAGTGLGHVSHNLYKPLQRAKDMNIPVVMSVQTIWGYTGMDVYETGRRLQDLGVIPGKNMLPEVALTKMSWLLGNYDDPAEIRRLIPMNIAGEITVREPMNGYQVFQGVENIIPPYLSNSNISVKNKSKKQGKNKKIKK